jgi:hypothetical protein
MMSTNGVVLISEMDASPSSEGDPTLIDMTLYLTRVDNSET